MNNQTRPYKSQHTTQARAMIKSMNVQVVASEPDLQNTIRNAFALAKSGGRELNLDFNLQPQAQIVPKPSDIRARHLVPDRVAG